MRGYRFTPPLLAPAARVNSSQRSPISNRRGFSTPHPGLLRRLRWLDRLSQKLELFCAGSLRISRPKQSPPRARRRHPAASKQKTRLNCHLGPQNRHRPPHTSRPPTTDGKTRPRASVPEKKPFSPQKGERRRDRDPTQARARRARTQREREPSLTTKQYTAAQSPAPGAAPTTRGSQYGRGARTGPEAAAAAAQHGLGLLRRIDPPLHDGFGGELPVQRGRAAADERSGVP